MVPFDQLEVTYLMGKDKDGKEELNEVFDEAKHDKLAPLEILSSSSLIDFLLHQPAVVERCLSGTEEQPSLIELFIRNQEEIRGDKEANKEEKRKLDKHFDAAFGEDSFWRRQRNDVW